MNGTKQEDVLSWHSAYQSSYSTMALAVDAKNNRLYLHDGYKIAYTDTNPLTGTTHTLSIPWKYVHYASGLAVKEDYIYWGDWSNQVVYRVNKISLNNVQKIVSSIDAMDLHVYHNNSDTPGRT